MAIVFDGETTCALCDKKLQENESLVLIPAFFEDSLHSLWKYTDVGFHRDCFMQWERKVELVSEFNEYYKKHYRGIRVMDNDGNIFDARTII